MVATSHADGDALIAEYNGTTGALQRRYIHGDQVDEPWTQYNSASVGSSHRRYLHANHQGSIIAHSGATAGMLNILAYDSFGIPANGNVDRFGYTGQLWFKELGLFHYKARMYAPKVGRFLQTDPIFYEDQMNMYAYVGNDPVNNTDPTGEWLVPTFVVAGLAAVGIYMAVDTTEKGATMITEGRAEIIDAAISGESTSAGTEKIEKGSALLKTAKSFSDMSTSLGKGTIPGDTAKATTSGVSKLATTEIKSGLSDVPNSQSNTQTEAPVEPIEEKQKSLH